MCFDKRYFSLFSVDIHKILMISLNSIHFQTPFHAMTHHWSENKFATCGQQVDIWDEQRSEPIRSFTWGVDSIGSVKFNPVEVIMARQFKIEFIVDS